MSDAFSVAFKQVVGIEGKYSNDERDPGNWTGGKVGAGKLNGTMYGISAAAYPNEDIAALSLSKAQALYLKDYWDKLRCDTLPDQVAIALFAMGVNLGVDGAAKAFQRSLKVQPDGVIGQLTVGIATSLPPLEVLQEFLTECAWGYTQMTNFPHEGKGWLSRVVQVALNAVVA